jgi:hypothetical protein
MEKSEELMLEEFHKKLFYTQPHLDFKDEKVVKDILSTISDPLKAEIDKALELVKEAIEKYSNYPEVCTAIAWNFGRCGIETKNANLVKSLAEMYLNKYYEDAIINCYNKLPEFGEAYARNLGRVVIATNNPEAAEFVPQVEEFESPVGVMVANELGDIAENTGNAKFVESLAEMYFDIKEAIEKHYKSSSELTDKIVERCRWIAEYTTSQALKAVGKIVEKYDSPKVVEEILLKLGQVAKEKDANLVESLAETYSDEHVKNAIESLNYKSQDLAREFINFLAMNL